MIQNQKTRIVLAVILVFIGILLRILPHAWNFTPLSAIALFSAFYLGLPLSLLVTSLIMIISDVFLGFYHLPILISVYASVAVVALIGSLIRKKRVHRIIAATLSSATLFFIFTNFAVWKFGTLYESSFQGLLQSYTMALPFFRNALAGDIFYTAVLFGLYEIVAYALRARKSFEVQGDLKNSINISS